MQEVGQKITKARAYIFFQAPMPSLFAVAHFTTLTTRVPMEQQCNCSEGAEMKSKIPTYSTCLLAKLCAMAAQA